ncbi:NAD-dependent epimerase/dehydratase family protein [Bradyrhizobium sp. ISRA442]|uniref:NAD-dependent epimerase/dehydratase family protein n=1 Tax=Bradyrhizobium sp. ISRA442 TaxID=2866197 RepID=UPI00311B0281
MSKRVLITGGAGFIGSHVADLLLSSGYSVRVLDALTSQVHRDGAPPIYLNSEVELIVGDVRNESDVERALVGADIVIHLAAAVGVGQSMYEIVSYTSANDLGTAVLMQAIAARPVEKLVCASSMSVYGEGLASRNGGDEIAPQQRSIEQLRRGVWEVLDNDGAPLNPLPTPESKSPSLSSIYALGKYNQERQCLIVGSAYGIPTVALRFFNVYGPRQSLSNPYTGVLSIFASRLLNDRTPLIFEDGNQCRDFVHVQDVARACKLALECRDGVNEVYNIGSGERRTINSVAIDLARVTDRPHIAPCVTGKYRAGDIRHCFADITKARNQLGYAPKVDFDTGLRELAEWLTGQAATDSVEAATRELENRGLVA